MLVEHGVKLSNNILWCSNVSTHPKLSVYTKHLFSSFGNKHTTDTYKQFTAYRFNDSTTCIQLVTKFSQTKYTCIFHKPKACIKADSFNTRTWHTTKLSSFDFYLTGLQRYSGLDQSASPKVQNKTFRTGWSRQAGQMSFPWLSQ